MQNKSRIIYISLFILFFFGSCKDDMQKNLDKYISQNSNSTKIKLRWLAHWHGEGKKETLLREITREFSLLHQDIEVELVFPHEMAKIKPGDNSAAKVKLIDTLVNMVGTNSWPFDIMLCDAYIYPDVSARINNPNWGKEFLVDFTDQSWFIDSHKNNFFETKKHTDIYGGIAPGAYIEGIWNLLYLSSGVEKRLGLKIKTRDMNLSDFTTYANAVFEYNQSHSDKITFFSWLQGNINLFFNQIVISALGKERADNNEEAINALQRTYKALEKLAPYKPLEQNVAYKDDMLLFHDKSLFILHSSWINLIWQKSNPAGEKTMYPCEIPSIDNMKAPFYSGIYSSIFVVPKNAENRKAAEMLMQFISSQETAEKWIKYSKCPTGLKNQISYSDFGTDEYSKFSAHISGKYQDRLDEVNLESVLFNSNKNIDFQEAKVINGEISADAALQSVLLQIGTK